MRDPGRLRRALKALATLMTALLIAGCASLPTTPPDGASPLVYDADAVAAAETVVVALPGVLNSVSLYDPAEAWRADGIALARYRYPGMDGLKIDHRVTVESAVATITAFAARHPDKRLGLMGFSAGGQLALEAAAALSHRRPRVVVMSSAQGFPETLLTGLRGAGAVVYFAAKHGSLDLETIWRANYPVLLYGWDGVDDPARQADIERIFAAQAPHIVVPRNGVLQAQAGDLTWRALRVGPALAATPVLILHGAQDPSIPLAAARRLARRLPKARLHPIEGGGHLIYLTHPEVFDLARAFFLEDQTDR